MTWSPSSKEFGIVYGYMPAKTTIFNTYAEPIHNFSLAPRNTIMFSPHGKFVLVAGFGNLAGQMDIYDLEKDYAKVTLIEASNASVCEWSPDGKHILTATTSPRLRVDNGVRIWHVMGSLMYNEDMNELYDISWRPQPTTKLDSSWSTAPAPHPSAQDHLGKTKTPSKPAGAYRPPGARGTTTPLHFKREDEGGAAFVSNGTGPSSVNGFGSRAGKREVPGAERADEKPLPPGAAPGGGVSLTVDQNGDEVLSKAAVKNKKKREAKKAKEAAEGQAGGEGGAGEDRRGGLLDVASPPRQRDRSRSQRGDRPRRDDRSRSRQDGGRERSRNRRGDASPSPSPAARRVHPSRLPANDADWRESAASPSPAPAQPAQPSSSSTATPRSAKPAASKTPRLPPGLTPLNPSAFAPQQPQQPPSSPPSQLPKPKSNGTPTAPAPTSVTVPVPSISETLASPTGGSPHDKKVRALLKKLRAIEELKMRQAGGEALELSQVSKISTEEKVRGELEGLGGI